MSELGDLLELMHGARERWTTARLVLRRWHDVALGQATMQRRMERQRSGRASHSIVLQAHGGKVDGTSSGTYESTTRMWLDPGRDRYRTERSGPEGESFVVQVGEYWWSYHPSFGATSNEDDPTVGTGGPDEATPLLDPALVLGVLAFEIAGREDHHGRAAIAVHATRRDVDERALMGHYLPDADDYELLLDAERGVILRLEARVDEQPCVVLELVEVHFDDALSDEVFVFRPHPGETIRGSRERFARPQPMSLEEAVRTAPFTVLAPRRLPTGWHVSVTYFPGQDRPPQPPGVHVLVGDPDSLHGLRITQSTQEVPDGLDWVETDFQGESFRVYRAGGPIGGGIEVKLERHGTHVRMTGDLEEDAMLRIAHSLEPASPQLPPLVAQ